MSNIAEFITTSFGRIDVTIGSHVVATIRPQGKTTRYGFVLPNLEGARETASIAKARGIVLQKLADWFRDLGPSGSASAVLLDMQAETERRSATA